MSTYLVTGAAGFIGAKVCEFLLADGHTVVGIDNLNDYYDVRLKDYRLGLLLGDTRWTTNENSRISAFAGVGQLTSRKRWLLDGEELKTETLKSEKAGTLSTFVFEQIDIENLPALERLFQEYKFDAVFNLAARAGVRYSLENPHVYMTTNAHGTLNLLECMRKFGVKKFVLASTSSLYAGCPMPFTEDQPVNTPLSPYAASKKAGEMMAYSYHKMYGIDVSVLRYFTVYGPAGRPDMAPYRFVHWIATGQPLKLFGDGSQIRDFTYVDDIARGTILAAKPLGYQVLNLGGGNQPITINSMIRLLEEYLGRRAEVTRLPPNPSDMTETAANIEKAGRVLGWRPEVTPGDGFKRTVAWYQQACSWLGDVEVEQRASGAEANDRQRVAAGQQG